MLANGVGCPWRKACDKAARWSPAARWTVAGHEAVVLLFLLSGGSVSADLRSREASRQQQEEREGVAVVGKEEEEVNEAGKM